MNSFTCQKNQVVFREGDFAETMYEILSGTVGIYSDYGTENEKELNVLEAGEVFGEMGLVECFPRSATAVVLSDEAELRESNFADFQVLFKDRPDLVLSIMRQMSNRLRSISDSYVDVCNTIRDAEEADAAGTARSEQTKGKLGFFQNLYLKLFG